MHYSNSASWKWRHFIKRQTQYNGYRKNRWSRDLPENGNSRKYQKNKSALQANNLLTAIEVYYMMELNLWLQSHITGVMAKWKENPVVMKVRDRSCEFSHVSR